METPEHLAVVCPPQTQQLIQGGSYVNLACFIPKEEWEERTSTLEWSFADGAMKQTSTPRQIKTIDDWTNAFIRFAGVYCQAHPTKCLELFRYMDIIRQAEKKWGGFGWRA